ncbi:hypothetical protein HZS_7868 [Henneguya salminicola]|nr:hypothetical protein HZS_7868 [Henneguya salminicola]
MIYKFALLKRGIKSGLRSISTPNIISLFKENLALFRLTNLVTQYPNGFNSKIIKVQRNSELNEVIEKKEILDSFLKNNIKPLQYDRAEEVDHDLFKDLLKMGLFSAPKELGGLGFNASQVYMPLTHLQSSLLLECLPKYDLAVAVMFGVQQTIGSNAILKYGSTFLKSTYIPKVVDCKGDQKGITAFLVYKKFGGITTNSNEKTMGIKCAHSVTINFINVRIPASHIIGSNFYVIMSDIGDGFKIAMDTLNYGRFAIGVSLNSVMRKLLNISLNHAMSRIQFGKKLIEFEDIKFKIANMASLIYATDSLVYYISGLIDSKTYPYNIEAAALKIFASESAWRVCDETIQILGGRGYMENNEVEKIMRDLRIFKILEGTNDILRQFIFLKSLDQNDDKLNPSINSSYLNNSKYMLRIKSKFETLGIKKTLLKNFIFQLIDPERQIFGRFFSDYLIELFIKNVIFSRLLNLDSTHKNSELILYLHLKYMVIYK